MWLCVCLFCFYRVRLVNQDMGERVVDDTVGVVIITRGVFA